ncbi:hypothetical protein AWRI3578_g597 [Hanseniaspora opuntiae]|uniref:Uncharacterized protein n=1 Tax=Hanseniaspora opuntiae TaxID=211096 RepID=A0A1E5RX51_9ASCO|nr:hypothetical protein AWRI3578_g597 [Hanseniaspora opuntiae]
MFQEFSPVVLLISDNSKHQIKSPTFDKENTSKFYYQYVYDLPLFNKITNIDSFLNHSYNDNEFIIVNYSKERVCYNLIFDTRDKEHVTNNMLSIMESLKNFHIVLNYYFELLYTQENIIKSVSNRLTNTFNERDLNQMISTKSNLDRLSKEKDHQVTVSKILDHTDRLNLLLSVNLSFDNKLLEKVPLPKNLLSFFETFAKVTSEKTKTDTKILTNEIFIDVIETHLLNNSNEIISINGTLKTQTNIDSKVNDRAVVIKTDKFEDINGVLSKDKHGIQVLKNYSILNSNVNEVNKFPILLSYQYTNENEITLKLNTNNVKYANTVRIEVSLNEKSKNAFKVVTQGDLKNNNKTWDSKILNSKSGNLFILKIKDIEDTSLIRMKCQITDGKGDPKGLNVKKVIIGDSNIFKGVKYTLNYEKEIVID